jgi:hypothetical protein
VHVVNVTISEAEIVISKRFLTILHNSGDIANSSHIFSFTRVKLKVRTELFYKQPHLRNEVEVELYPISYLLKHFSLVCVATTSFKMLQDKTKGAYEATDCARAHNYPFFNPQYART